MANLRSGLKGHISEGHVTRAILTYRLSIRCQFQQHFMRNFFVQKFAQSQTLSREKLLKRISHEKGACKTLMKLTQERYVSRIRVNVEITSNFIVYCFV